MEVLFGYTSTFTTTKNVPASNNNFFLAAPLDRNQQNLFDPGVTLIALETIVDLNDTTTLQWNLGDGSATAFDNPAMYCVVATMPTGIVGQGYAVDLTPLFWAASQHSSGVAMPGPPPYA
jgi:hypothetical protein